MLLLCYSVFKHSKAREVDRIYIHLILYFYCYDHLILVVPTHLGD